MKTSSNQRVLIMLAGQEVVLETMSNDPSMLKIYQLKKRGRGIKVPITVQAAHLISLLQHDETRTWFTIPTH